MLEAADYRTPTAIFAHGFLTVNGQKMSKSRGTFITAENYLKHLNPEYLRYYFAAKLNGSMEDIDLNFDDFVARVNSDLIGKYVNIASRCAKFITDIFDCRLSSTAKWTPRLALNPDQEKNILEGLQEQAPFIADDFENRRFGKAISAIMHIADMGNVFLDFRKPWVLAKALNDDNAKEDLHHICTIGINIFRLLTIYLKPILPQIARAAEQFLNVAPLTWDDARILLTDHVIKPYEHLAARIDPKHIEALIAASTQDLTAMNETSAAPGTIATADSPLAHDPVRPEISYDDFAKIDLRIATIVAANHVEGAEKLLQLTLDIGGETRNVYAGIKEAYDPATLVGRQTVMIANLAPRKMRFGVSEGMVLAAGPGKKDLWILAPDQGAQAGMRVK